MLVGRDAFLVLNLSLHVVDRVGRLDVESDSLAGESLHEDLHTTTEAENQVKSGLFLDVVVGQGATVFKLLAGEDKALLIRGNAFLILDLGLYVVDRVDRFDVESDGFTSESLNENLHLG